LSRSFCAAAGTFVLLLFATLGAWRYQSHPLDPCLTPSDLAFHNGSEDEFVWVTVEGIVYDYPNVRDRTTNYTLRVHTLELDGTRQEVKGALLLRASRYPEFEYGDEVRASGLLQTPPDYADFSYREYLARRGVRSLIDYPGSIELLAQTQGSRFWTALYSLRSRLSGAINRILPEPQASLLNGILLGIESGIPRQLYDDFNATGTSHIIVVSGFNITVVAGLLTHTLGRVAGRRRAIYPVVGGIIVYALLAGAEPAVLRAAIMGILYVLAIRLGRQSTAVVSLAFSALVMTAFNPLTLWDVGFQLSFMSILGMTLFTPPIQSWFERRMELLGNQEDRRSVLRWLSGTVSITVAAQITTVPLVAFYFGRLSLVSLLANPLILLVQPAIMILGSAVAVLGLAWLPLARLVASIPWFFLQYTVSIVQWAARLPLASIDVGAWGWPVVFFYYVLLFGGLGLRQLWHSRDADTPLAYRRAIALTLVGVIPLWLGVTLLDALPDGRLHIWFIGLGSSDAMLVQTPAGRRVLVDAGRGEADVAATLRTTLPGWSRRLDLLVLTQGDVAHTNPLPELLDRFRVSRLLLPEGVSHPLEVEPSSASAIIPPMNKMAAGMRVQIEEGVLLEVLHAPSGVGPDSAVLRLSFGALRVLLPSEIEQETQAHLLADGLDLHATVLKAPHMGTGNWPTDGFLVAVHPQIVLVPEGTTYPPDVQDRLRALSAVSVDGLGTVEVISDGSQLWIRQHSPGVLR